MDEGLVGFGFLVERYNQGNGNGNGNGNISGNGNGNGNGQRLWIFMECWYYLLLFVIFIYLLEVYEYNERFIYLFENIKKRYDLIVIIVV